MESELSPSPETDKIDHINVADFIRNVQGLK